MKNYEFEIGFAELKVPHYVRNDSQLVFFDRGWAAAKPLPTPLFPKAPESLVISSGGRNPVIFIGQ